MRIFMAVAAIALGLMSAAGQVDGQGNTQASESFVLSGVITFDGGGGFAWLQEPKLTNNQAVAMRRGDTVGPYRLTEIFEDRVELEGPAGKVLVPLFGAQGAAAPQTAAVSPVPAPLASLQQLLTQGQQPPEGRTVAQEQIQQKIQRLQEQIGRPSQAQPQQFQEQLPSPPQQQTPQQLHASPQQLQTSAEQSQMPADQTQASTEQTRITQPSTSVTSGLANNPHVIFVPMGDSRRSLGLGALLK